MENTGNFTNDTDILLLGLGPKQKALPIVIILLIIYGLIFISGVFGNICTCIVVLRNTHMRTTTNYYLLSLAISDVLILITGKLFYFFES